MSITITTWKEEECLQIIDTFLLAKKTPPIPYLSFNNLLFLFCCVAISSPGENIFETTDSLALGFYCPFHLASTTGYIFPAHLRCCTCLRSCSGKLCFCNAKHPVEILSNARTEFLKNRTWMRMCACVFHRGSDWQIWLLPEGYMCQKCKYCCNLPKVIW